MKDTIMLTIFWFSFFSMLLLSCFLDSESDIFVKFLEVDVILLGISMYNLDLSRKREENRELCRRIRNGGIERE